MRSEASKARWWALGIGLGLLAGALAIECGTAYRRSSSPSPGTESIHDDAHPVPTLRGRGGQAAAVAAASDQDPDDEEPATHALVTEAIRMLSNAWAPYEAVIDGVPERMEPDLLAVIAGDDALYDTWVELWHAFDARSIASRDMALRDRVEAALTAYLEEAPAADFLLPAVDTSLAMLSAEGHLWLYVLLVDELLPRIGNALVIETSLGTNAAAHAPSRRLGGELHAALAECLSDPQGPFVRLRGLARRARELRVALRDRGEDPVPDRPFDRWAKELRALLFDPDPVVDTNTLSRALRASPSAQIALRLCVEDIERTVLLGVPLSTLQIDGAMHVPAVNRLARSHVDRCLAFLSLLEVDTPRGKRRLHGEHADNAGARLYLLVSAAYRRLGPAAFSCGGATWFAGLDDGELASELSRRHEDLERARQAMWELLAVELQSVVRGGGR